MSQPLRIGEYLSQVLPRLKTRRHAPEWPPDMFALAMSLIQKSGAYACVLDDWPPKSQSLVRWGEKIATEGKQWRRFANKRRAVPAVVDKRWASVVAAFKDPVAAIRGNPRLSQAVLELCALADEACAGVGVNSLDGFESDYEGFYARAEEALHPTKTGSSLCLEIDPSRIRVLPKMHAPAKGLTVRSLSHHLALCCGDEIQPVWVPVMNRFESQESLNLLLIPRPTKIEPIQFSSVPTDGMGMKIMHGGAGYFSYRPSDAESFSEVQDTVLKLYRQAKSSLGSVDGIIFPELSMTPKQFASLRELKELNRTFLISGIAGEPSTDRDYGTNQVHLDFPNHGVSTQGKHHRWKLDGQQINQYGLGSRLNPERSWWEHIDISSRKLNFFSVLPWMTLSAVICEDLARPDPVGDLLRAVGPSLVVALLMDGPQIKERWAARYASTLAEDPGSSVLSVTSLGMSALSRPASGQANRSRVIGLWKDAESNSPVEIELPIGHDAAVLSLSVRWKEEWTADGRRDGRTTGYPLLSGIHPIKGEEKE